MIIVLRENDLYYKSTFWIPGSKPLSFAPSTHLNISPAAPTGAARVAQTELTNKEPKALSP